METNVASTGTLLDCSEILKDWECFLHKVYGIKANLFGIAIPEDRIGNFPHIICKPGNLTYEQAFLEGGKRLGGRIIKHLDCPLNAAIDYSFGRDSKRDSCIIRISRDGLNSCSAVDIINQGIITWTLMELLLFRDYTYWKFKKDIVNYLSINWCPGSKFANGYIPGMSLEMESKKLKLFPINSNSCNPRLIARKILTN